MSDSLQPPKRSDEAVTKDTRRARYFLYVIGAGFAVLGMAMETVPSLAELANVRGARLCALFGAMLLAVGRFAPDRWIRRCEQMLTGWP